jgi:PAS domain S-box-containing protein
VSAPGELEGAGLDALARTLLVDLPDAVIYADRDGTIRYWNPGAERIFGFTKAEAISASRWTSSFPSGCDSGTGTVTPA